jgi:hypothetical protein
MTSENDQLLEQAAGRLRDAVLQTITPSLGTLTLGLKSSTGREIPLLLQRLANGEILVSDGGETWGELVMTGHARARPTVAQLERIKRLAKLYELGWEPNERAFEARCTLETLPDVAGRVTSASIALDGFRALSEDADVIRVARRPRLSGFSGRIARAAGRYGWDATPHTSMPGKTGFPWPTAVVLKRRGQSVGVRLSRSSPEVALEQAVGCAVDTDTPIVLLSRADIPKDLMGKPWRVEVLPGLAKGRDVFAAADRLTAGG